MGWKFSIYLLHSSLINYAVVSSDIDNRNVRINKYSYDERVNWWKVEYSYANKDRNWVIS